MSSNASWFSRRVYSTPRRSLRKKRAVVDEYSVALGRGVDARSVHQLEEELFLVRGVAVRVLERRHRKPVLDEKRRRLAVVGERRRCGFALVATVGGRGQQSRGKSSAAAARERTMRHVDFPWETPSLHGTEDRPRERRA